jgi:hypothetical protein
MKKYWNEEIIYFVYAIEIKLPIIAIYHPTPSMYTNLYHRCKLGWYTINLSLQILSYWSFSNSGTGMIHRKRLLSFEGSDRLSGLPGCVGKGQNHVLLWIENVPCMFAHSNNETVPRATSHYCPVWAPAWAARVWWCSGGVEWDRNRAHRHRGGRFLLDSESRKIGDVFSLGGWFECLRDSHRIVWGAQLWSAEWAHLKATFAEPLRRA